MAADIDSISYAGLRLRGRNFMALVIAPELPIAEWIAALDEQLRRFPALIAGRPVVADLSGVEDLGAEGLLVLLDGLEARELRLVGIEGVNPRLLARTRWERLATVLMGRDAPAPAPVADEPEPVAEPPGLTPSLLISRPVRSGESIVFEEGDVTIVGHVASGADVIAGGSIHIYGALRGRAIAGLRTGEAARIFCRKLEAEMVGLDRLYRTAEHWGEELHGRAVQVLWDRGALKLKALD